MATPYKIVLGAKDLGTFHQGGYNAASAAKVTEVLQHNLDNWDVIFSGRRHSKSLNVISVPFPHRLQVSSLALTRQFLRSHSP